MKGRRIGAIILAATLITGLLSGCGASTSGGSNGKDKVTIQYFTWTAGSMSAIEPMVEKFNETNEDNIQVEVVLKTGDWETALKTAILSGQAPDIMNGVPNMVEALSNGWIEPWDDYLSADFKQQVNPYSYKVSIDGEFKTYGFVWGAKTYMLAYNQDLFDAAGITEPPTTWQEVYQCAQKITEAGDGEYYGFGLSSAISGSAIPFVMEPIGAYEGFYKAGYDFNQNKYNFSHFKPYIELFRTMIAEGLTFPGAETLDNDSLRAQFAAGRIGIIPSASWDCAAINEQFGATCNWQVIQWPTAIDGENKGAMVLRDLANYHLSSTSKNKEAAAKFVEFMLSEDYQSEMLSKATDMSILPWAIEAAKEKPAAPFEQWLSYTPTETMVQTSNVSLGVQIIGDNEYITLAQLISNPGLDIDDGLNDLSKRYNDGLYEQAKIDAEKAALSEANIDFQGKIMTVKDFDSQKQIAPENIVYITAEEWLELQK